MTMAGPCCAQCQRLGPREWALVNFGSAELGDARRTQRLVNLAAVIMEEPRMSLPKQLPNWSDLVGAYRLLSNPQVDPQRIIQPHSTLVRQQAAGHPVVLCVQDDTQLDFTCRSKVRGLGIIGDGRGRGLLQHAALAVLPDKRLLGVVDLAWHAVAPAPTGETLRQQQARWTMRDVWFEAAQRIGEWPEGSRLVHVGDRGADLFSLMHQARKQGHDFVLRSMHDRYVDEAATRLWAKLQGQAAAGHMTVQLGVQRDHRSRVKTGTGREAQVTIRLAAVEVAPPRNDPRTKAAESLKLYAVYVVEELPPAGIEAVEWMLLTSLTATTLEQAQTIIGYYTCRWVIEEWHRCLKEGCRAEQNQLDDGLDIQRLTGILAIVAVRLLQMRDLAESAGPEADSAEALQAMVPPLYVTVVAGLSKLPAETLTPRQFWRAMAKQGGYLGRKNDPRPGWKVLWRGWSDLMTMVRGAQVYQEMLERRGRCV